MIFQIRHTGARVFTVVILLSLLAGSLIGQTKLQEEKAAPAVTQAPVAVNGKTLFTVRGVLSFTAAARADAISRRIHELSKDILFKPDAVTVADSEDSTDIMAGDVIVMSVTDQDASLAQAVPPGPRQ